MVKHFFHQFNIQLPAFTITPLHSSLAHTNVGITTRQFIMVSVTNGENGNLETVIAAHTDADMTDAKCDITFTNYYKPIKKTSESTTETIPTTKRKPETKPGNKTSIKKSKNKVKTGDNSNATLFAILLLVSGTGLLIIAISRYREKYHK